MAERNRLEQEVSLTDNTIVTWSFILIGYSIWPNVRDSREKCIILSPRADINLRTQPHRDRSCSSHSGTHSDDVDSEAVDLEEADLEEAA